MNLITGGFIINQPYNTSKISEESIKLFAESDYNIVNLESLVTNSESKILETGFHISAEKNTLEILKNFKY